MPDLMAPLFPEPTEPSSGRPRARTESMVNWLRRSTRPVAGQARQLLNTWLEPLADDADLRQRILGDDASFRGAFLEVYLDACFRQAGWNFERAPELLGPTGRPERPDFVVNKGSSCYFEAAATNPQPDPGAQQRQDRLLDHIDHMDSPNFDLMVEAHQIGPRDVPGAALERELKSWLNTLDPDDEANHSADLPAYTYDEDGWLITFEAAAIRAEHRGSTERTIGGQFYGVEMITDEAPLMRALKGTAKKYRSLDAPYVVAVDEDSWEHGAEEGDGTNSMWWHRTNTLFGESAVITSGPAIGQHTRKPNGFWRRSDRYQNTRVSAVLLTDHLSPYNALQAVPELWVNPAATHTAVPVLPLWRGIRFGWAGNEEQHHIFRPAMSPAEFWAPSPDSPPPTEARKRSGSRR